MTSPTASTRSTDDQLSLPPPLPPPPLTINTSNTPTAATSPSAAFTTTITAPETGRFSVHLAVASTTSNTTTRNDTPNEQPQDILPTSKRTNQEEMTKDQPIPVGTDRSEPQFNKAIIEAGLGTMDELFLKRQVIVPSVSPPLIESSLESTQRSQPHLLRSVSSPESDLHGSSTAGSFDQTHTSISSQIQIGSSESESDQANSMASTGGVGTAQPFTIEQPPSSSSSSSSPISSRSHSDHDETEEAAATDAAAIESMEANDLEVGATDPSAVPVGIDLSSTISPFDTAIFLPSPAKPSTTADDATSTSNKSNAISSTPATTSPSSLAASASIANFTPTGAVSAAPSTLSPSASIAAADVSRSCAICSQSTGALLAGSRGFFFHAACLARPTDGAVQNITVAATSLSDSISKVDAVAPTANSSTPSNPKIVPSSISEPTEATGSKSTTGTVSADEVSQLQSELSRLRSEREQDLAQMDQLQRTLKSESEARLLREATSQYAFASQNKFMDASIWEEKEQEPTQQLPTAAYPSTQTTNFVRSSHASPFSPKLPGLSTAPLITPIGDATQIPNYPTTTNSYSFLHMHGLEPPRPPPAAVLAPNLSALHPLAPLTSPGTNVHHLPVFAREYPSMSLTGRTGAPPAVQSGFVRPSHSGYQPPPKWGQQIYQTKCIGDEEPLVDDHESIENEEPAASIDVWSDAFRAPDRDELTYEEPSTILPPTHTQPMHLYLNAKNVGNTHYPSLHPSPSQQ